ncbi:MAG: OmpA family protein [Sulfuritalea sp.]|nr:OmpA family protein [Sulfuritalea sp.]
MTLLAVVLTLMTPVVFATSPAAQVAIPAQKIPDTWKTTATEDSAYFSPGSSRIDSQASRTIQRHAARLVEQPGLFVTLVAHTDDLGSASIELAKGHERLLAVKKMLEDLKVSGTRIRTENHGNESRAGSTCGNEECRRKNRRVDFVFRP